VAGRLHPLETVAPAYSFGTAPVFGVLTEDGQTYYDLPRREHYDLNRDPSQQTNLYHEEEAAYFDALFARLPRAWPPAQDAQLPDRETLAALEALGYITGTSLPPEDTPAADPKDRVELANFITVNSKLLTPSQALAEGTRLHERFGPLPALARFRAQLLDSIGLSLDAIDILAESAKAHPDNALLARDLEERRKERSERQELARAIRAVLVREPDHPRARHDLALTLHQLQQTREAEALYEAILADDATDDATRLNLVRLLMAAGRAEEAYERVEEARARPDHDHRLDCAAGRILAWYLDRPALAVDPLLACRDGGARLTPLDVAALQAPTPSPPH
jgi:tetratricopeptide (TPR) repeat protein